MARETSRAGVSHWLEALNSGFEERRDSRLARAQAEVDAGARSGSFLNNHLGGSRIAEVLGLRGSSSERLSRISRGQEGHNERRRKVGTPSKFDRPYSTTSGPCSPVSVQLQSWESGGRAASSSAASPVLVVGQASEKERISFCLKEDWTGLPGGEAAAHAAVVAALGASALFQRCEQEVLERIAAQARSHRLETDAELEMADDERAWIVVAGALEVRVGSGQTALLGPETLVNSCALLGSNSLHHSSASSEGEKAWYTPAVAQDDDDERTFAAESCCIRNLCSQAFAVGGARGSRSTETLKLSIMGAPSLQEEPSALLKLAEGEVDAREFGAILASISVDNVNEAMSASSSQEHFQSNRDLLAKKVRIALHRQVLPNAPVEVVVALAEVAHLQRVGLGRKIASEGEAGGTAERLVVLDAGEASVEKCTTCPESQGTRLVALGTLGPGAIIGDVCFIGASIPRQATVRAKTPVTILTIPAEGMLSVLQRFPGSIACLHARVRESSALLQPSLRAHTEVLSVLKLFAQSSSSFTRAVASASERRVLFCGDVVKSEGGSDATLYVVEFGLCSFSSAREGDLGTARIGTCFGERTLLGIDQGNHATVRVATPFAVLLMVPQTPFNSLLVRFPDEERRIRGSLDLPSGVVRGSDVANFPCFRTCSQNFCEHLAQFIEIRYYSPGQTLMVEGAIDSSHMFVLKGGRAVTEKSGERVQDVVLGSAFGEFAMLGLVRRRAATVRAATLCQVLEVPRPAFLAALDKNPEDRQHFEKLTTQYSASESSVSWPLFVDFPANFLYHVNLYTDRQLAPVGSWISKASGDPLPEDAAVLVLQGTIRVEGPDGERLEEFVDGQCFNEQVLVGFPRSGKLVPQTPSEVQIMTKETFDKVMAALPDQRAQVERSILQEMANKALEKLGFQRGGGGILRFSSLFRAVSDEFIKLVSQKLEERIYQPGELITEEGGQGDSMYLLLAGDVEVEASGNEAQSSQNKAFGEAVLLGIATTYSTTLRARSNCLVQALSREHLLGALVDHPTERRLFAELKAKDRKGDLRQCIKRSPSLPGVNAEFVSILCQHAEDVFYAPGEEVITRGDSCGLGRTSVFVLLSGQALVEGAYAQCLGRLGPGQIFGEAGGLGFSQSRIATVRAWNGGLTHCARLQGRSVEAAIQRFPDARRLFRAIFEEREVSNAEVEGHRQDWVLKVVVPVLRCTRLFADLPGELLQQLAQPLVEVKFAEGENITQAGEISDSLIFLLRGEAEVQSKEGRLLGRFTAGAVFGEASVLELLPVSTATVRAIGECHALVVPGRGVREAASSPGGAPLLKSVRQLRADRLRQADCGLPMCALRLSLAAQDVCARIVNMQAECTEVQAGEAWYPLPDSDPCGPRFGVLASGRAHLVLGVEERPVMPLLPGSLLPEGLFAKYGAHMRTLSACDVYRIRLMDFLLALGSAHTASFKCFVLFQALWKEAHDAASARLKRACGVNKAIKSCIEASTRPGSPNSSFWPAPEASAILAQSTAGGSPDAGSRAATPIARPRSQPCLRSSASASSRRRLDKIYWKCQVPQPAARKRCCDGGAGLLPRPGSPGCAAAGDCQLLRPCSQASSRSQGALLGSRPPGVDRTRRSRQSGGSELFLPAAAPRGSASGRGMLQRTHSSSDFRRRAR